MPRTGRRPAQRHCVSVCLTCLVVWLEGRDAVAHGLGLGGAAALPGVGVALPTTKSAAAVFCSAMCRSKRWRTLQHARRRVVAMQRGHKAICPVCRREWTVGVELRRSAVFCLPRCRTRAWRAKASPDSVTVTP